MRRIITTASFRAADRYEAWSSILADLGLASDPPQGVTDFRASVTASISAALTRLKFDFDSSPVRRLRDDIRKFEWGQYWIYREIGSGSHVQFGDREVNTLPGDLMVADADTPFRALAKHRYLHDAWMIPRAIMDRHLPPLPRPLAIHLPGSLSVSHLIVAYLDALSMKDDFSEAVSALASDHLARLIAVACGSISRDHGEALRVAKLEQARRYVEENLSAHDLNPEKTAAALRISLRQLHLCFEPSGESFGQYVRRRRLEECRASLVNPLFVRRPVTDIAFAWGFSSLPTFYRAFSDAFGATPRDLRAQAFEQRKPDEQE